MKVLLRSVQLLCLLLLGGYSYLYAHTGNSNEQLTFRPAQSHSEKKKDKLKATIIEDEDHVATVKKHTDAITSFVSLSYPHTPEYVKRAFNNRLIFRDYVSYSPPHRYIMYRAIRI